MQITIGWKYYVINKTIHDDNYSSLFMNRPENTDSLIQVNKLLKWNVSVICHNECDIKLVLHPIHFAVICGCSQMTEWSVMKRNELFLRQPSSYESFSFVNVTRLMHISCSLFFSYVWFHSRVERYTSEVQKVWCWIKAILN